MESDTQIPMMKETNSIKLNRGMKGQCGWEIKIAGDDETDILKRIKMVNDELVKTYTVTEAYTELNKGG